MQGEEQLVWETYFGGREYDPQFDKVARKFGPFFERVLGDKGGAEYREESGRITLHFRTLDRTAPDALQLSRTAQLQLYLNQMLHF